MCLDDCVQTHARGARKHADVVGQPAVLGRHKVAHAHVRVVVVLFRLLPQPAHRGLDGGARLVLVHQDVVALARRGVQAHDRVELECLLRHEVLQHHLQEQHEGEGGKKGELAHAANMRTITLNLTLNP
eukprot:352678-Chlamydomonas_euryale.AAC.2